MSLKDRWPTWGSSGEQPLDGTQYEAGDNVAAATLNYLWYQINRTVSDIEDKLSNKAGSPHGNEDHSSTFAVAGDTQPPETHDNTAHSETYLTSADVDGAPNPHDNSAHDPNFLKQSDYNPQTDTSYDTFSGSHNDLTNIGASDHHTRYTDSEAAVAAPVQSVNGKTGSVSIDTSGSDHERYTDSEAAAAAPVQSVNGKTGDVTISSGNEYTEVYLTSDLTSSDIDSTDVAAGIPWDASSDTTSVQLENAGANIVVQNAGTYYIDVSMVYKNTSGSSRQVYLDTKVEKGDGFGTILDFETFQSRLDLSEGGAVGIRRSFLKQFDTGGSARLSVTGDALSEVELANAELLGRSSSRDQVGSRVRIKKIGI